MQALKDTEPWVHGTLIEPVTDPRTQTPRTTPGHHVTYDGPAAATGPAPVHETMKQ